MQTVTRHSKDVHADTVRGPNKDRAGVFLWCRHCDYVINNMDALLDHFASQHGVSDVFLARDDILSGVKHNLRDFGQYRCAQPQCATTSQCNDVSLVSSVLDSL